MTQNKIRNSIIGVVILAIIIVLGIFFLPRYKSAPLPQTVQIDTSNQPTLGDIKAPLHIVAFEDLKCANCMRYSTTVFPKINQHYIKTGKARYTLITLAFIPGSMPAANAALCIHAQNNDAYFQYVEYLYAHQPPEETNWATIPNLMLLATHVKGINADTLAQCLVSSPYTSTIANNLQILQSIMQPPVGTPAVYINGVRVDPLTWKRFQEIAKQNL